ncbi:AtpZ/AtpI family protein [Desulfatitalea alkaliphila]|uniref:AtpZ/AtpI family protein n=1 Tax=Desulfatitalea alkaliphila TaxID=2929485 RepID=A0AA41R6F7_9BACT|nr:AtpZ/AtpI family protein [Desulfatitalea alkaliphila]MCJ8502040.1 AtpZ/AtpI family protein [Desulfatitalea alkaliphila]
MPYDPKKFRLFDFKKNRVWSEGLAFVMQIGLTMAGCIFFCFFVGLYLDRWLGTGGIFIALFIILGVVGGAYTAYRQIQETFEKDERRRRKAASDERNGND